VLSLVLLRLQKLVDGSPPRVIGSSGVSEVGDVVVDAGLSEAVEQGEVVLLTVLEELPVFWGDFEALGTSNPLSEAVHLLGI
jgi:hypothetical protein